MKVSVKLQNMIPYFIEFEEATPLTTKDVMVLLLLFELATLWKKLVFLSLSLSESAISFCLPHTSSKRDILSKSLVISTFRSFSTSDRDLSSAITSRSRSWPKRTFFYYMTLPNFSSLHFFKLTFKAFSLHTRKPDTKPLSSVLLIIRLKVLISMTNKRGDKRSYCHSPREVTEKSSWASIY